MLSKITWTFGNFVLICPFTLSIEPYREKKLFPFFFGLHPLIVIPGDICVGAWYVEHNRDGFAKLYRLSWSPRWARSYHRCRFKYHPHHHRRCNWQSWVDKRDDQERIFLRLSDFTQSLKSSKSRLVALQKEGVGGNILQHGFAFKEDIENVRV